MKHFRIKCILERLFMFPLTLFILIASANARVENYKELKRLFVPIDTIDFNINGLVIAKISKALIIKPNIYVILDEISHSVFLIDIKSRYFKQLSVEDQLPGIKLEPYDIALSNNNGFWVSGSKYRYFLFNSKGELKKYYITDDLYSSGKFAVDARGNLILYNDQFTDGVYLYFLNVVNGKKRSLFRVDFPKERLNSIRRFLGGGLLIDHNGYIYVSNAVEDKIYVYDLSGNRYPAIKSRNLQFSMIKEDLPSAREDVIQHFMQRRNRLYFDLFLSMNFLNTNIIAATFVVNGKLVLELFSTSGKIINKQKIFIPSPLVFSQNNHIYLAFQPEQFSEKGYLKNPVLIKYKFKGIENNQ